MMLCKMLANTWLIASVLAVPTWAVAQQPAPAESAAAAEGPAKAVEEAPTPLAEWQPFDLQRTTQLLADWSAERGVEAQASALQQWDELVASGAASQQPTQALLLAAGAATPDILQRLIELEQLDLNEVEALQLELSSGQYTPLIADHLRLWAAIRFAHEGYYDESLELLTTVPVDAVIDPAALLFYRGLVEHQLVKLKEAKWSLESLLTPDYPLPSRYEQLARLLLKDLSQVEPESLDEIARQMNDVHRRLSLGAADKQVQIAEDDVSKNLDKMIEKLEEQQRQQQQMQQQAQNSSQPMEDSQLVPTQAPGDVDIREIGHGTGWGNLPPKERERVMQQIGREFPTHYREVIEEYFRRLATDQRDDQAKP